MAEKDLVANVSPHLHQRGQNIETAMRNVLIALIPAFIVAIIVYGFQALYVILVSMITAGLTEYVMCKILRRKVTLRDMSAMVTGLLFAFLLPPTTPLWVVAIGAFIAIAVAKQLFGGLGKNIFNPALFARVVLMISPLWLYIAKYAQPFFWKQAGFFTPVVTSINNAVSGRVVYKNVFTNAIYTTKAGQVLTSATPLSLLKSGKALPAVVTGPTPVGATWLTNAGMPNFWSSFIGFRSGSLGELSILALVLGGCYLVYKRTIDWRIPVGILGAFLVVMLIAWNHPLYQLMNGGIWLGALYMATDWTTSPLTKGGKWIYAVGIGLTIAFIRLWSPLPEGTAIAILEWNVLVLLIDRYVPVLRFGWTKRPLVNKLPFYAPTSEK